ncbi:hypothetical protein B0I72DRAFT_26791 [Yarrowia lipolytica]|jgi:hypothetical protein|uniref:Uncharacterized protein n=1 Tax=Yarrowia lipolytica TaxID=4952 RepID=A0A371C993_YARLL|nr:hypothetical protein B0I71DRAFT_28298 [Yarrowia lipolytica]RDW33681.1 hypothetical protein B0I72DRAFT_26791 [Yarrowia lipolytica]RDW46793.1 hypothetical protein B0I74DRAFT_25193 [Yarrowia lipolytica]RDW52606.1 hypothetical protein B0I75DRAFT_30575 [Yarrowia lipolytica]
MRFFIFDTFYVFMLMILHSYLSCGKPGYWRLKNHTLRILRCHFVGRRFGRFLGGGSSGVIQQQVESTSIKSSIKQFC